ncbi:hypothetical protein BJ508DRAFT_381698 [Ascobolus immersus RN42]|uniref:Uncharacterized protein n=1 Tax=Ascobolus immersus RN42 TaxID=1160509 RepID=A0A3N4HCZ4_ASCIM|nr:hypothetical protein BJ508DRAFT_381698 [Ascobolus immersus RN42]
MSYYDFVRDEELAALRADFYTPLIRHPILIVTALTALIHISRSLRLKSNILHVLSLFALASFFMFVCTLVTNAGGLSDYPRRWRKATLGGINYAYAFSRLFELFGLIGTQFVAYQLVYPDSKPSEKWIYRVVVGVQAMLTVAIFGLELAITKTVIAMYNFDYSGNMDIYTMQNSWRYMLIALFGFGLLATTLLMWGSLNYRRQKSTFPQTTQKRIVGYAITFPMWIVYLFYTAKHIFYEVSWRVYSITMVTTLSVPVAFDWIITAGLVTYFVGWIFLVREWKRGNRAAEGEVSMADFDLKPELFSVGGAHGKDARSSVSV